MIFPVPVTLKRLRILFLVLNPLPIFTVLSSFCRFLHRAGFQGLGIEVRDDLHPFILRRGFQIAHLRQILQHAIHELAAQILVAHLPAPKNQRDLDLVAVLEKVPGHFQLGLIVMLVDLGPNLEFFYLHDPLFFGSFFVALALSIAELSIIHYFANGGHAFRRNLNQIQALFPRGLLGLDEIHNSQLLARIPDQTDLPGPYLMVDL